MCGDRCFFNNCKEQGREVWEVWGVTASGFRVSFWDDESIPILDCGDNCTVISVSVSKTTGFKIKVGELYSMWTVPP